MKRVLIAVALVAPLFNPISASALQTGVDVQSITRTAERFHWNNHVARVQRRLRVQHRLEARTAARLEARAEAAAEELAAAPVDHPYVDAAGICWDCIAQCESHQDWDINTGNGYYGGLQFKESTWLGAGGPDWAGFGDPWLPPFPFSRSQQITVASRLGLSHWPHCQVYA